MAEAGSISPVLKLRRSDQSGSKVMTAVYANVYNDSSPLGLVLDSGTIDLSTMLAGDHIDIQISKVMTSGGAWVVADTVGYDNAQPAGHPSVQVGRLVGQYGIRIQMRQTAGVLRTIPVEFYDQRLPGT